MSDYSYIKPVVDLTCWTDEETKEVISILDAIIKINERVPADSTLILRHIIVKLLNMSEEVNPATVKPLDAFNNFSLNPPEDFVYIFGPWIGPLFKLLCDKYKDC